MTELEMKLIGMFIGIVWTLFCLAVGALYGIHVARKWWTQ